MTTQSIILSVFEVFIVVLTVWGLFNEEKFITLEDKIKTAFNKGGKKI